MLYMLAGVLSVFQWTHLAYIWLYKVEGPSKIIHLKYLYRNKAIGFVGKVVRASRDRLIAVTELGDEQEGEDSNGRRKI